MGGRSVRRRHEFEHGFLPLYQNENDFMEDTREILEAQIWTDPENHCSCWNSSDGGKVVEIECKCNGTMTNLVPDLPANVHRM
jgi:hypothetical protein